MAANNFIMLIDNTAHKEDACGAIRSNNYSKVSFKSSTSFINNDVPTDSKAMSLVELSIVTFTIEKP